MKHRHPSAIAAGGSSAITRLAMASAERGSRAFIFLYAQRQIDGRRIRRTVEFLVVFPISIQSYRLVAGVVLPHAPLSLGQAG